MTLVGFSFANLGSLVNLNSCKQNQSPAYLPSERMVQLKTKDECTGLEPGCKWGGNRYVADTACVSD